MKLLITICARGGSKGIPKKNIRTINGKPLIAYSINHANRFKKWFDQNYGAATIELSTDSPEIIEVASSFGLCTEYMRPVYLANDTAGKLDAIKDVLLFSESNKNYDYILDLDVSAPLRTLEDLIEGFKVFINNKDCQNLFSVSNAHKNPYFNMVEENDEGFYSLSKKGNQILSRQTAPIVYEMNASFYFYKRAFFNQNSLYLFSKSLIYKMEHTSFDLDEVVDFEFLEFLLKNNKLNFEI